MSIVAGTPELDRFIGAIRAGANAQFTCRQHERLFAVPLTLARARRWMLQLEVWGLNRRDCWAAVQSLAPFDVKRLIWDHESDELAGSAERGVENHRKLGIRQGELFGLTAADFENEEPLDGTRTCTYAWLHLARSSDWRTSLAASAALEISNSSEWVDGGGMSLRRGMSFERQLGIPFEKQVNHREHAEVDVEHANILLTVARRPGTTQRDLDLMLEGLHESWAIERTWKLCVADMLEAVT